MLREHLRPGEGVAGSIYPVEQDPQFPERHSPLNPHNAKAKIRRVVGLNIPSESPRAGNPKSKRPGFGVEGLRDLQDQKVWATEEVKKMNHDIEERGETTGMASVKLCILDLSYRGPKSSMMSFYAFWCLSRSKVHGSFPLRSSRYWHGPFPAWPPCKTA